jgi:hypothetical protein
METRRLSIEIRAHSRRYLDDISVRHLASRTFTESTPRYWHAFFSFDLRFLGSYPAALRVRVSVYALVLLFPRGSAREHRSGRWCAPCAPPAIVVDSGRPLLLSFSLRLRSSSLRRRGKCQRGMAHRRECTAGRTATRKAYAHAGKARAD